MENWAYEPECLNTFARHFETGEPIPADLIGKITASRNYLAGYQQVRQLKFGLADMAWHTLDALPEEGTVEFEHEVLDRYELFPVISDTAVCPSFTHIFSGGYCAGYYSYKWAEVLEADAFGYFKEKGLFGGEAADKFRTEILQKGSSEDESLLYRRFRGRDPEPEELLRKLGLEA
jgi:peptidyl-dipeptidase Dcp